MADQAKVPARRSLTWLWMILALVVAGGFLAWLGIESEPTSVPVVVGDSTNAGAGAGLGFTEVSKDSLKVDKSRYAGQAIRVAGVMATGALGPRIFWGDLGTQSNQVPILLRLDSAAAAGFQMQPGASYTVLGTLNQMSDSVSTAWAEAGDFAGEGERMQADFADYFIEVSNIQPSRASSGAGSSAAPAPSGAGES